MTNLLSFELIIGLIFVCAFFSRDVETAKCTRNSVCIKRVTAPVMLGEGPHWDDEAQVLYFVDIPNQKFFCYNPATERTTSTYLKNGMVGVAIPIAGQKNRFVAGAGTDFVEFTWDPKKDNPNPVINVLATVDGDRVGTRFNDGKIDPRGRFWGGTMGIKLEPELGSLYRIDTDNVPKRMISPVSISNGLAWSHDNRTFYYIDSPTHLVVGYDYDLQTGNISNRRIVFDFKKNNIPGIPDGMTIDNDGTLWIAVHSGGQVIRLDPIKGQLLKTIEIPAARVTSVAFGGKNRDILYVTTAKDSLTEKDLVSQPNAGAVFAITGLGVRGKPMLGYRM